MRALACHVPGGNCYHDPVCECFGDCCDDAPKSCSKFSGELLTLIFIKWAFNGVI